VNAIRLACIHFVASERCVKVKIVHLQNEFVNLKMRVYSYFAGTCMGKCVTGPNFRLADGIFKMDCQTCRPKGFALKEVTLTCPGNRKRRFEIREATSCMCEKCPWKKRLL
jgi:Zn finger protein HypA/HybF involved in hydrogenase expression